MSNARADLIAAGWTPTRTGRWSHPRFPGTHGRVRLFAEADALTLTDGDPKHHDTRTPQQRVADAVHEALAYDAAQIQHRCDEGFPR